LKIEDFRLEKVAANPRRQSAICILKSAMILVGCVTLARGLAAEGNSSLTESKIENAETKVTAADLLSQNEALRRELSLARESVRTLTDSLAESNVQAEVFRRKYSDLQLRMEALGLESADKDRAKLEQRLLSAVSDLQLLQKEREQYRDQSLRLSEAILHLLKTSTGGDAQARMDVETQLRSTNELIAKAENAPAETATLMDGSVISVKEEWSLVVGNIGEKQGVKMGMPMRVMRGDKQIATLRVVDVRQRICGAVIQEMDSGKEKIKVGDRLQADARKNVTLK
jgi:predicted  nucleic acid-binding Zn-ribbon protein